MKILIWKHICTPMFIAALFTIAKISKQSKYLSAEEWIRKMGYIYTAIKMDEIMPLETIWIDLEGIVLSAISQAENDKYLMILIIKGI